MIWTTPPHPEELNRRAKQTLSDHLGIEFVAFDDRSLTAKMAVGKQVMQPMGIVHGGATAALAETVASAAANYCIDQTKWVCVGVELNINHIRPISSGTVTAIATPLHLGKSTQVWEVKVYDGEKRLTSASRLTLMTIAKD